MSFKRKIFFEKQVPYCSNTLKFLITFYYQISVQEFLLWLSRLRPDIVSVRMWVQLLALIRDCHKLWCRSQMGLESGVAMFVVQACSCGSNLTISPEISICCRFVHKKKKKSVFKLFFSVCVNFHMHTPIGICWLYLCRI